MWAPGLDQGIQVHRIGEVEELIAQPADLGAGRQSHGERGVEHRAAGLRCLIGVAGQVFQLDVVVHEELAQLIDDVRAVCRTYISHVGQGLRAIFQRRATHHVDGECVTLGQQRQAAFEARQGVPATGNFQHQGAALAVAGQAGGDDGAAVFMAGAAQDVGQLHGVGAEGTDDKELFANCGGGHAAFLKR